MASAQDDLPPASKFPQFLVKSHAYKTVLGTDVCATVHIPKALIEQKSQTKHPVILRYHGGFLFTGGRIYGFWPDYWVLKLGLAKGAVVISADYRLLPEARGIDVLEDLGDVVRWIGDRLPSLVADEGINVDTGNVLVTGESAGGWCSTLTALHFAQAHPQVRVRACISLYGVLDIESPFFTTRYEKVIVGTPMRPSSLMDEQVARIKSGEAPPVCPGVDFPVRAPMAISAVQNGRYLEFLGPERELYPFDVLEQIKAKGAKPPPIWLFHGKDDTAVPWEGSDKFAAKVKELFGEDAPLQLTLVDGEHGIDIPASLDQDFLVEGLTFIERYWG